MTAPDDSTGPPSPGVRRGRPMNLLIMGPPGSGKGTQGARLAEAHQLRHIATGDLLRAEVSAGTPLGKQVADIMDRGDLVPDDLITELAMPHVLEAAAAGGYLLDGFPRSLEQAREARPIAEAHGAEPHAVLYLDVDHDELMRRILARAETEGRTDDNAQTVDNRLQVFDATTRPLVDHYRERGLLHVVPAERSPDEVFAALERIVADLDA